MEGIMNFFAWHLDLLLSLVITVLLLFGPALLMEALFRSNATRAGLVCQTVANCLP